MIPQQIAFAVSSDGGNLKIFSASGALAGDAALQESPDAGEDLREQPQEVSNFAQPVGVPEQIAFAVSEDGSNLEVFSSGAHIANAPIWGEQPPPEEDTYLQPDGVFGYLQPDGVFIYLQPT